jgi:hypothetical protein
MVDKGKVSYNNVFRQGNYERKLKNKERRATKREQLTGNREK